METSALLLYLALGLIGLIILAVLITVPLGLWLAAWLSGVRVSPFVLMAMKFRRVNPANIVNEMIKAKKANLKDVNLNALETHFLARGDIKTVVDALISAKNARIDLDFAKAAAIDLAGRNVLEAVKDSVNPKVIEVPDVEAISKDGIQLIVKSRLTVIAEIDKLIGGAGEDTVVARVGEGIVAAIGSAERHDMIMSNPEKIREHVFKVDLPQGIAYSILSLDIADIDVGENIGAALRIKTARAESEIARAKAEEKLSNARADEQVNRAKVQEMRSLLVAAEAEVPRAIAEAFRLGHLGIMDYYRMQNMDADTKMRRSFSNPDDETDLSSQIDEE